jgi:acyl-coenzyme A synthetase/AMP-(fatty) acid ligase
MNTVYESFAATSEKFGAHDFLHIPLAACAHYANEPISWSYSQALEEIRRIASQYLERGLGCGDIVSLMLENRPEFFLHYLALNSLGCCIVPLHADAREDELAYLISRSDSCAVIALDEHADSLDRVLSQVQNSIPHVGPDAIETLPQQTQQDRAAPGTDTPAAILFTSGTTGKPKGCVLPNRYFHAWGRMYTGLGGLATLTPGAERLITPLPTNHTNALGCSFMGMVASGGCIVQVDRFSSSRWWDTVRESRATILHYLGVMPAMLLNLEADDRDNLSQQVKFGLGAGVDPEHQAAFEARFGFPLLEGWAMTETGGVACVMAHREPRHVGQRCLGKPPPSMEYRLVDREGRDVEPGENGELLVRSSGPEPRADFFNGYYKDPKSTEEAWAGDYFHTGDLMRLGEDGSLFFVDRQKNIIRRSGENIAAAEVEAALIAQPEVVVCAVAPVPDEFRGEEVMALIVPAEGIEPGAETADTIVRACLESLSYHKVPGHIGFVGALPVGSTQKIKQGEIKGLCKEVLGGDKHFVTGHLKKRN